MTRLLGALVLILVIAGCGKSGKEKAAEDFVDSVNNSPKCSEVWVVGGTIPDDYEGCTDGAGALDPAFSYDCADGSTMFVHGDTPTEFWTIDGKVTTGSAADFSAAFFGKAGCKPT